MDASSVLASLLWLQEPATTDVGAEAGHDIAHASGDDNADGNIIAAEPASHATIQSTIQLDDNVTAELQLHPTPPAVTVVSPHDEVDDPIIDATSDYLQQLKGPWYQTLCNEATQLSANRFVSRFHPH
jgi:hypothetical protein